MRFILPLSVVALVLTMMGCSEEDNPVNNNGGSSRDWQKTFGGSGDDYGYSVAITDDYGYIIAGATNSSGSDANDMYLIRTNVSGDTLWTQTIGGPGNEAGISVAPTDDGGFIVVGYTDSYGAGGKDVYLVRTDSAGDTLWTRTYGGASDDIGTKVIPTPDGGYIISGSTESSGAGGVDVYLIKTDASGNITWERTYGGPQDDSGESLALADNGDFIVAGYTSSFGSGPFDMYLVRANAVGDTVWTRTYGGGGWDYGHAIAATTYGGFVIAGRTDWFGNGPDIYLVKIDDAGDTLWTRSYGGANIDRGYTVAATYEGGCFVAGFTMSTGSGFADLYVVKVDINGATIATRQLGGDHTETATSVAVLSNGGCIVTGYTGSFGEGSYDVYLVKLIDGGLLPRE